MEGFHHLSHEPSHDAEALPFTEMQKLRPSADGVAMAVSSKKAVLAASFGRLTTALRLQPPPSLSPWPSAVKIPANAQHSSMYSSKPQLLWIS